MKEETIYSWQDKPSEAMIWHMERLADAIHSDDHEKMAKIFNEALIQAIHEKKPLYKLKIENG